MPWIIRSKWKFGGLIGVIIGSLVSCSSGSSGSSVVSQVNVPAPLTEFHVAKTGMDENTCAQAASPSQPKLTINGGISCLAAGDALIVHAGTYDETIGVSVPNGTSWSDVTTIRANSGDTVIIQRTSGTFARCVEFISGGKQYIEIDGIDCDGTVLGYEAVKFAGTTGFIRINDMEAFGHSNQGILDAATGGGNEFLNLNVHNNGSSGLQHGIYITSDNNKIWDSDFHANSGYGVVLWNSTGTVSNNDIQYNRMWDNGVAGDKGGFGASGDSNLIANNLVWDNNNGGLWVTGTGNKVYNNTIYSNSGTAGIVINTSTSGTLVTNNINYLNDADILDLGSGTVQTTNLTTDPSFADADADDFHLLSGSAARNAGTTLTEVTDDFDKVARPQESAYAIGAFEF